MLKIKDNVDLKELEQFIGIEIFVDGYKNSKYLITGTCIDNYMGDECKRNICFQLDNGDDIINIENIGKENNEFVPSKQLDSLIQDGLVEKVDD